jgi:uncharacterized surface protein with fasciclin (FAS1) repeats
MCMSILTDASYIVSRFICHTIFFFCLATAEIICDLKRSDDFSTACTALKAVPVLHDSLNEDNNNNSKDYTVFVPTNEAFSRAYTASELNSFLTTEEGKKKLEFVLETHIIKKNLVITFKSLKCENDYRMRNDQDTKTECGPFNGGNGRNKFQVGKGNDESDKNKRPRIILKDIRASNGIIQGVNNVILPIGT